MMYTSYLFEYLVILVYIYIFILLRRARLLPTHGYLRLQKAFPNQIYYI